MPNRKLQEADSSSDEDSCSSGSEDRPRRKKYRIIANLADTQYAVIRDVCRELGWRLQNDKEAANWDLLWTDNAVEADVLGRMQQHQKVNHFPGMFSLARKNHLARSLIRLRRAFPLDYSFFPDTWLFPAESAQLRANMESSPKGKVRTYIVKPQASCQGRGIFLLRNLDQLQPHEHYVVQRYLCRPYLIDHLKFDLRIYVLVVSCDPLRLYIYKEGIARFATIEYETPRADNLAEMCMHLTNYAINKDSDQFTSDDTDFSQGHKRSLSSIYERLHEEGVDVQALKAKIHDIIVKTMIVGQPVISHHYRACQSVNLASNMCFELLGFDIMLDHHASPILLEINHSPSFNTDTQLDLTIKEAMIRDTLRLVNVSVSARTETIRNRKREIQSRIVTGKKVKLTPEERRDEVARLARQREEYQRGNQGDFQLLYPKGELQVDQYSRFLECSQHFYQESTDIKRATKVDPASKTQILPIEQIRKLRDSVARHCTNECAGKAVSKSGVEHSWMKNTGEDRGGKIVQHQLSVREQGMKSPGKAEQNQRTEVSIYEAGLPHFEVQLDKVESRIIEKGDKVYNADKTGHINQQQRIERIEKIDRIDRIGKADTLDKKGRAGKAFELGEKAARMMRLEKSLFQPFELVKRLSTNQVAKEKCRHDMRAAVQCQSMARTGGNFVEPKIFRPTFNFVSRTKLSKISAAHKKSLVII